MASRKPTQREYAQVLQAMDALVKRGGTITVEPWSDTWLEVKITNPGQEQPRVGLGPSILSAFTAAVSPD